MILVNTRIKRRIMEAVIRLKLLFYTSCYFIAIALIVLLWLTHQELVTLNEALLYGNI